jgi:hypothetical protein
MYVIKSVAKNKGTKPIIKVHIFSCRVAIATFNKNKTREAVSILLSLIHFTGNTEVGESLYESFVFELLRNNIF